MATIRYKKRFNKYYVYELHQYWDKELKKPRQKTKYLGVADQKNGPYHKPGLNKDKPTSTTQEKAIVDFGDSYAIQHLSKDLSLDQLIEHSFGNLDSIMALICFELTQGSAMYNCQDWMEGNIAAKLFPAAKVSSQAISQLIKHLGKQENQIKFFRDYVAKFFPTKRGILIDSTALPSAINSSINAYGYANGSIQEHVSCLMLVDQASKLPIYFRTLGGDIADVSTLETTIREIKELGLSSDCAILDAGFCSKANLTFLCKEELNFVTRLPKSHQVFNKLVTQAGPMEAVEHAVSYGERVVFIKSQQIELYGQELYAHLILDPSKKSRDSQTILKNKLDTPVEGKEKEALDSKLASAGFFILLSRQAISKQEILPTYYIRQSIEQVFGHAKSSNQLLPLRVHDEASIRGYLMLMFLVLIVSISMRRRINMPIDKALLILGSLKAKIFEDTTIVQEPNKKVKDLFKDLKL